MKPRSDQFIQFNLRTVFYLTFLGAVLSAVSAPLLRAWNTEQQLRFLVVGGVELLLFGIGVYWLWHQRERARDTAGRVIYRSSFRSRMTVDWLAELKSLFHLLILLVGQFALITVLVRSQQQSWFVVVTQLVYVVQFAPMCFWNLMLGVDRDDLEVCELGLIHGMLHFLGWEQIHEIRPSQYDADQLVLVVTPIGSKEKSGAKATITLRVPAREREQLVQEALAARD